MTISTLALFAVTGFLILLKLAIMVVAVALLAKTMFAFTQKLRPHEVTANLFKLTKANH
ncbi:MAG: hypothetical protein LJE83_14265 [Gammaproteobacteria bacterium]|nr:hypothetical protein [Gammaproteobacteria bacterium]